MANKIVIPARLASTRFPQKLLANLNGQPLLLCTIQSALAAEFDEVVVAVDDECLADIAHSTGATVVMTDVNHVSGTSRLSEACQLLNCADDDIIINLQADEPLMPVDNLKQVAGMLAEHPECEVATICEPITTKEELFDPHAVKVVFNHKHYAMYFSRATIPWEQTHYPDSTAESIHAYRHIGLYGYRAGFLKQLDSMPESKLQEIESLEQLRWLDAGHLIRVDLAKKSTPGGVDTVDDLARLSV